MEEDDGNPFSPVKCAERSLDADDWVTPTAASRPTDIGNMDEVLNKCSIKINTPVAVLRQLVEAGREIAVRLKDGKELVPKQLIFMAKAQTCGVAKVRAVMAKLLEIADVKEVATVALSTRQSMAGDNQAVFVRSVTARALDMVAIEKNNGTGLGTEGAGAIFSAGYKIDRQTRYMWLRSSKRMRNGCSAITKRRFRSNLGGL